MHIAAFSSMRALSQCTLATCALVFFSQDRLQASSVTAAAEVSSGLSYKADPLLASTNPAISGNAALKASVTAGDDLLAGNLVLIGSFNLTDAQIQANAQNVAFLTDPANFVTYGSLHISDNYPTKPGWFTRTLFNNTTSLGIAGRQIYILALAATDNSTAAKSIMTAFQIGIFYESIASWKFPAESDVPNATSFDLSDLTVGQMGLQLDGAAHVVVGSFGPDKSNNAPTALNFVLASIPEPAPSLLAFSSAAAVLARRRRFSTSLPSFAPLLL